MNYIFTVLVIFMLNNTDIAFASEIEEKTSLHKICIFCSADDKIPSSFKNITFDLGLELAKNDFLIVTGGTKTGLMNEVVNGFVSEQMSLKVFGIVPEIFKEYNVIHPAIPKNNFVWTNSIHERLSKFTTECDTMIILPGGFGTLHEMMDLLVHQQLDLINKKIILFNALHYWDSLLEQFSKMIEMGALDQTHLSHLHVVTTIEECIKTIKNNQTNAKDISKLEDRYWENK